MAELGMDVDQMDLAARKIPDIHAELQNSVKRVFAAIDGVKWLGTDKGTYVQDWQNQWNLVIRNCLDAGQTLTENLEFQIRQQREASGAQ